MVREEIVITARFIDKMTGGLRTVRNTVNQFGQTTRTVTKQFRQLEDGTRQLTKQTTKANKVVQSARVAHGSFSDVMGMNLTQWRQYNALGGKFKTIGGATANKFRLMTHGLRGFRMEMLGVMFFGMGLARFFTGLLQPALKLVGLFEIWGAVLGVLFLPIALKLLEVLLPIMDWLIVLPEPVKMAIGIFVLLAAIFFNMIFLIGMFALGIGSLIQAFGGMAVIGPFIAGVGAVISASIGLIIAILAIVVAVVIGFALAWKENFGKIKGWVQLMWVGIKQTFKGIVQFFKSIWMIISGLFSGNSDKIIEGFKLMGKAIMNILKGVLRFVGGLLVILGLSILRALWGAVVSIGDLLVRAYDYLKGKVTGFVGGVTGKIKGGRQVGGFIPHEGLYRLHAGETVTPAGDTFSSSPTINVYGVGAEDIARQVSEMVTRDLASLSRR